LPYKKSIEKFISFLPPKCSILDVGCGPGVNALHFTAHGHHVTGIDFSKEMIKLAREVCPAGTFRVEDVNEISLDKKYNAVCASFVIVHLTDNQTFRFFKKLPRLLTGDKPKLYLSFMTGKTPGNETTSFSENPIFFNYYDQEVIKQKLAALGFVVLSEETQPYPETDGSITNDVFLMLEYRNKK
jgi:ubiquinone/menaquinone biosynthesis C-methylase UbiE